MDQKDLQQFQEIVQLILTEEKDHPVGNNEDKELEDIGGF